MTRCEAIDILKNTIVRFGRTNGKTVYAEALQMAIKALEEPQWIPCSEMEPKKSGYYLCTHGGTGIVSTDYYTTQEQAEELFADPEDEYLDLEEYMGWTSKNVIAWMPLPASYVERREE